MRRRHRVGGAIGSMVALIVLAVLAGALLMMVKGRKSTGETDPSAATPRTAAKATTPKPEAAAAQPAISVDAADLVSTYQSNKLAADNRYRGKRVEVSGVIEGIGTEKVAAPYVMLKSGDANQKVQCTFPITATSTLADLRNGQAVRIEGTCTGLANHVEVTDCRLMAK